MENQNCSTSERKEILVPDQTAFILETQKFDKLITAAELEVARLKNARASYIFDNNMQLALKKYSQNNQVPAPAKKRTLKND
jgi:hypothetical protein